MHRPVVLAFAAALALALLPGSASAAARSTRPPGLVQAGNSKTTCIYAPLGAPMRQAMAATGIHFQCVEVFATEDPSWRAWTRPWVIAPQYGYTRWLAADPTGRTVILTINLVPDNVAKSPTWRAVGASGAYDAYARALARNLVAAGFGSSVIRLGPEMNGPWEADWIGTTPAQWGAWAAYFARIVRSMRSVPGAHFLFDWNVNAGYKVIPLASFYPGNAYVDIVGIDAYDESPITLPPVGSPSRWTVLTTEPLGLDEIYAFARAHGKPASLPEWGTISIHGDDGAYVENMGRFVATHVVAYQAWYDVGDNNILPLNAKQAPRSLAAYVAAFGPRSPVARYQQLFVAGRG